MDEDQVREFLKKQLPSWGDKTRLAEELGVSASYVSQVLTGKKRLSDRILERFGFSRVVEYRRAG